MPVGGLVLLLRAGGAVAADEARAGARDPANAVEAVLLAVAVEDEQEVRRDHVVLVEVERALHHAAERRVAENVGDFGTVGLLLV